MVYDIATSISMVRFSKSFKGVVILNYYSLLIPNTNNKILMLKCENVKNMRVIITLVVYPCHPYHTVLCAMANPACVWCVRVIKYRWSIFMACLKVQTICISIFTVFGTFWCFIISRNLINVSHYGGICDGVKYLGRDVAINLILEWHHVFAEPTVNPAKYGMAISPWASFQFMTRLCPSPSGMWAQAMATSMQLHFMHWNMA